VVLSLPTTAECVWYPAGDVVQTVGSSTWVNPPVTTQFTAVMTNEYGCVDSTHFTIPVYDPLPLQITPDTVICIGSGVNISVSGSWNYIWDNGIQGNSQFVTPTQTTTYTVSSTDLHECITSVSTTITVQPDYNLTLHHNKDTICVGDNVELWYDGVVDQHYWSTGSTENHITVSPLMDATYSLWAYNTATACAKTLFDTIIVIQYPVFMLSTPNLVCAGDTLEVRAFSDYHFDYHWSSNPAGSIISIPDSAEIRVSPQETSYYIYQASNQFCTLTDSVLVEVAPLPAISVDNIANETCMQSNGSVMVTVQSDYPPIHYFWSNGAEGASEIHNLSAGLYSLTVTDALGCTNSMGGIEIVNIPPPEIVVTSALGAINGHDGSIDIDVPSSYGDYTVEWFFNSWNNPLPQFDNNNSIDGLDSGYYYVMVTDEACSTTAEIFVPHLYFGQGNLYIPNTITPSNEDGINDYFQLYYTGDVLFKEVLVYNRWGTLVYKSNDIHFKWNGAVNGEIPYSNVYTVLLYYYDYRGTEHVIRSFLLVL
jgi:gliding motility-associated-like protein